MSWHDLCSVCAFIVGCDDDHLLDSSNGNFEWYFAFPSEEVRGSLIQGCACIDFLRDALRICGHVKTLMMKAKI